MPCPWHLFQYLMLYFGKDGSVDKQTVFSGNDIALPHHIGGDRQIVFAEMRGIAFGNIQKHIRDILSIKAIMMDHLAVDREIHELHIVSVIIHDI